MSTGGLGRGVGVIGAGYVGLTLSVFLASKGVKTICVERDGDKVRKIMDGVSPIHEQGLPELLQHVVRDGVLEARDEIGDMLERVDIVFITVGTPTGTDGVPDLSQVEEASRQIGEAMPTRRGATPLIVVKSTVPPGTTWHVVRPLIEEASGRTCGEEFHLCVNPEFLREGSALQDTMNPDRIVIGAKHGEAAERLKKFYEALYHPSKIPTLVTTPTNAELIKLATNAFLALKISFINLISQVCEATEDGDVGVVAEGLGLDPRIGPLFLRAGLGFGGSCLPKDLRSLRWFAARLGVDTLLFEAIIGINRAQRLRIVEKAESMLGGLSGKRVAVLGLAFKPGTDDVRESASIDIIRELLARGAEVRVHDPAALENARRVLGEGVTYCSELYECLDSADLAIIATEWPEYTDPDPSTIKSLMRKPLIIDGRRVLNTRRLLEAGIRIHTVGLYSPLA
ncbi:UDP-glucose 6-dehydrogenase TuaD [Candidatus Calditenuaceae archaeon HR02]|nr:UDP-glucose 6-dehydrogenase TuaD [Candidatus Calditenuaceae archaeon HR02]